MPLPFYHLLQAAGGIQFFLVGLFVITYKSEHPLRNRLLALFLIAKGLALCDYFFNIAFSRGTFELSPHFYLALRATAWTYGPAFYLYAVATINPAFRLRPAHWLHFLPASALFLYLSVTFFHLDAATKLEMMETKTVFNSLEVLLIKKLRSYSVAVYAGLAVWAIVRHRRKIKNRYSDLTKIKLDWLNFLAWSLFIIWAWLPLSRYIRPFMPNDKLFWTYFHNSYSLLLFTFANLIAYKNMKNSSFLDEQTEQLESEPLSILTDLPSPKSADKTPAKEDIEKLVQCLETKKAYLVAGLTLKDLAEASGLSQRRLTAAIRYHYRVSFFKAVNHLRIEAAKELLLSPKANFNITEILFEAGFSSKSVFNRTFKDYTGMTPSGFRSQYLKSGDKEKENVSLSV